MDNSTNEYPTSLFDKDKGIVSDISLLLITRPENLKKLIKKTPIENLDDLIVEVSKLASEHIYNKILLLSKTNTNLKETDTLILLFSILFEFVEKNQSPALILHTFDLISNLIMFSKPSLRYYEFIYQIASTKAAQCLTIQKLQDRFSLFETCIKLLGLLRNHLDLPNKITPFFYFAPGECKICLNLTKNTQWPFGKVIFKL